MNQERKKPKTVDDIDAINRAIKPKVRTEVKVAKPKKPKKRRKRDYDDILDEFWL